MIIKGEDDDEEMNDGTNVRVFLRISPLNSFEVSRRSRNCLTVHSDKMSTTVDSPLEGEHDFSFDQVRLLRGTKK